ncbi:MAG TPA: excinuclease ABC subunit UvrC [bacterium]|nr:excinuclease ABC subunit UvrC [bacterium]
MSSNENASDLERLKARSASFPDSPGVYLFKGPGDKVLYVGKALSLKKRTSSYFNQKGLESPKVRALVFQAKQLDFVLTADENEALLLESNLIKKHHPRYNVLLRDDKSYPYLKLTTFEDFPRVLISRRPSGDGAKYYGPYPNLKLREIVKMIYRYFNIRDCDLDIDGRAEKACLSYQIKQCPAPCVGLIQKAAYGQLVKRVQWFLEGKHDDLMDHVRSEMLKASERQEYEEAAKLRDLLESISQMQRNYAVLSPDKKDVDVFALAMGLGKVFVSVIQVRQGKVIGHIKLQVENELEETLENVFPIFLRQYYLPGMFLPDEVLVPRDWACEPSLERWLTVQKGSDVRIQCAEKDWRKDLMGMAEQNVLAALKEETQRTNILKEIQELLGLKNLPRGIACFDISTLQGSYTVGSAVFFRDGAPEKDRYRKFRIKELEGQDDFRSHQEMMRRYLKLLEREGNQPPDLFLIDGGKGQLSAVRAVLDSELKKGYGLASLAKREEEVFVPERSTPVDFRGHLKARHLLQRVRDESHRFAIGYHRTLRDRQVLTSLLQKVHGIGPARVRALLNQFGSLQGIQKAPLEDLATAPGLSRELSQKLFDFLHSSDR